MLSETSSYIASCSTSTEELYPDKDEDVRVPARVKYDFEAQSESEYTVVKGQSIIVIRRVDRNWCLVESVDGTKSGMVPTSYLEGISSTPNTPIKKGQARARFDYEASTDKEISFSKGDEIVLLEKIDDHWYKGRTPNSVGILPALYVDVLSEPQTRRKREETFFFPSNVPTGMRKSRYSLSSTESEGTEERERKQRVAFLANSVVGSISSLRTMERPIRHEDLIANTEKEEIARLEKENLLKNSIPSPKRNQSSAVSTSDPHKNNTSLDEINGNNRNQKYKILYSYDASNDDELNLLPGDIVDVVTRCDDGWYIGACQRTGAFGSFPGNFATLISAK